MANCELRALPGNQEFGGDAGGDAGTGSGVAGEEEIGERCTPIGQASCHTPGGGGGGPGEAKAQKRGWSGAGTSSFQTGVGNGKDGGKMAGLAVRAAGDEE